MHICTLCLRANIASASEKGITRLQSPNHPPYFSANSLSFYKQTHTMQIFGFLLIALSWLFRLVIAICAIFGLRLLLYQNFDISLPWWAAILVFMLLWGYIYNVRPHPARE